MHCHVVANYIALAVDVLGGHLHVAELAKALQVAAVLAKHTGVQTLVETKGSNVGNPTPEHHQHNPYAYGHATRVMFVVSSHGSSRVRSKQL